MRQRYGLLFVFLPACLSACGGGGGGGPTGTGGNPPVEGVAMTDNAGATPYAFSPASLTVKVGTTVKWTNSGKAQHTSTSDGAPPVWDSGTVQPAGTGSCDPGDPYCTPGSAPGGTYQRLFNTVGTYQYHCQLHGGQGMTGVITVTP
jgi:plastocyanin